jgi:alkanesulfonate monooxygenase
MTVEFIGMIGARDASETRAPSGPIIDPAYIRRFARAHEDAGFDKALIGYSSGTPDGQQVAAYAAAHTERLGLLIAHRPGFVFPTTAARGFATLDQLSGGRVAVHTITGGSDIEQARDGDYLPKDERYARSVEYLSIMRQAWESPTAFSHDGPYYTFEDYLLQAKPAHRIPLYFGGSSAAAYRAGGQVADVYALWGEPLAETAEQIAAVQAAAAEAGRGPLGISVSFRPILAATEELAWERAHRILATIQGSGGGKGSFTGDAKRILGGRAPQNVGSQRLLAVADRADRHDRALWTATAKASGAAGNSTALVGTPDTVAQALLDYVDIGVSTILIRGYDPVDDAVDYGRHLIPLVRQELAHRSTLASV